MWGAPAGGQGFIRHAPIVYKRIAAPAGLSTCYGVLATVGKDPLKEKYQISNVKDAQFQPVAGIPTPSP
jgi:hypothetical protein